ncbi:MAG: metallophosphoesterase [Candidatus Dadabacteria bacterium]|nr:MAG: metallophosphoesterase [Candidatus Dadabacteria bacterium]
MIDLFWRHFFSLLLIVVAIAEWVCATWLLAYPGGIVLPWPLHIAGPMLLYAVNRRIARQPAGRTALIRKAYTRAAFTSLFGFTLLLLVGAAWAVASTGLYVAGVGPEARVFLLVGQSARALASVGLLSVAAAMAYAYARGAHRLWINRLRVWMPNLPRAAQGLRIVQISDIHAGPFLAEDTLKRFVEEVNALEPDLVFITGDLADTVPDAERLLPLLKDLRASLGVYAVLGNHDRSAGESAIAEVLRQSTSVRLLCDEIVELPGRASGIYLAGLRDRGLDWARGLRNCSILASLVRQVPQEAPKILLSHRPDLFGQAEALGIGLVLSGHTHGGQLAIPLPGRRPLSLARFMTRYPRGTYRSGSCTLHVNLGLGVTGQPVRLATPREITLIELADASAPAAAA